MSSCSIMAARSPTALRPRCAPTPRSSRPISARRISIARPPPRRRRARSKYTSLPPVQARGELWVPASAGTTTEPMLAVSDVHAFYGNIEALRGVDVDVGSGEIVALIGANGAGKSTLLMTICGHPRAARGRIMFDGRDITRHHTFEIVRLGIAHVPEGRRIFPRMTVLENLQIGATLADPASFEEDLERVFGLFPILEERQGQRGGTLSGGEQQMLAIGRALMSRPRLLLLDEPSLGLAPLIVRQILEAIREINKRQK